MKEKVALMNWTTMGSVTWVNEFSEDSNWSVNFDDIKNSEDPGRNLQMIKTYSTLFSKIWKKNGFEVK